ncbi:YegP family protein [Rhodococcus ruber]|uniref:YegP family protein n=1 Tax=Rhodococcus ruber TaxID=1830 RepID=UPI003D8143C9
MAEHTVRLYRDVAGQFRWQRRARNGRVISDSGEGYTTKGAALDGLYLANRDSDHYQFTDDTEEQP